MSAGVNLRTPYKPAVSQVYFDPATGRQFSIEPQMDAGGQWQSSPFSAIYGQMPDEKFIKYLEPAPTPQPLPSYRPTAPVNMQGLFPNMGMGGSMPTATPTSFGAGRFLSPSLIASLGTPATTTSNP